MSEERSLEIEVQVPGTAEEVWRAIATGPGISSWYVPHQVEEREGGAAVASFGPGPEMQIAGRVAVWDPPKRILFDKGEPDGDEDPGLAFDWRVEPHNDGTCTVRLINTGFGTGEMWDGQYEGMKEGWKLFFFNLKLHMENFAGQSATAILPMAMWEGIQAEVWSKLTTDLGIDPAPSVGDRVETSGDAPRLAGTVVQADSWRMALLLDEPAEGTAFLAAEGDGPYVGVSVWSYLYGDAGAEAAATAEPAWSEWLGARGPSEPEAE